MACIATKTAKNWLRRNYGQERIVISSRAVGEAINRLPEKAKFEPDDEDEAKSAVFDLLDELDIEMKEKAPKDDNKGEKLMDDHEDLHYPDSTILAHYKREDIDLHLTSDSSLREISEKEGIQAEKMPTESNIATERVKELF